MKYDPHENIPKSQSYGACAVVLFIVVRSVDSSRSVRQSRNEREELQCVSVNRPWSLFCGRRTGPITLEYLDFWDWLNAP